MQDHKQFVFKRGGDKVKHTVYILGLFIMVCLLLLNTATVTKASVQPDGKTYHHNKMSENVFQKSAYDNSGINSLLYTDYKVIVSKATLRSGPSTEYPSTGVKYRDDIVRVRSIKDGWAKIKKTGKWHYILASQIKKK